MFDRQRWSHRSEDPAAFVCAFEGQTAGRQRCVATEEDAEEAQGISPRALNELARFKERPNQMLQATLPIACE
jgi:hypothetical protein